MNRHRFAFAPRFFVLFFLIPGLLQSSKVWADSGVVFNEIMYHPATNESALEWVELQNQNAVDVDLTNWRISGGIDYTFPSGVVIKGGGYWIVALSPATLTARTGRTNVVGPFNGRLANNGEEINLRDASDRLMDSVNYGVDGDWPPGPDGSGVSLVRKAKHLAGRIPANWTVSREVGGTPGDQNFPDKVLTGATSTPVPLAGTWRYNDDGVDLGTAWRGPNFNDATWGVGPALFFAEDASLPGPKNTPLVGERNTYYFRTTFNIEGDPAAKIFQLRPVLDDGAVLYLNGVEVQRINMPAGPVQYSTMAGSAVGNATLGAPINLPSNLLVSGLNVLAAELHQSVATTNVGLKLLPATGYNLAWDGNEGAYATDADPALAPPNDALASRGVDVFTSSNTNLASTLNDGRYGARSAWSPAAGDPVPVVILRFNQVIPISSIAWSRDNGNTNEDLCGGTCTDRALGNYTFQYTLATNPATLTVSSSNPSNGWATIATVQYLSAQPGFAPHLRHQFNFSSTNGQPIVATGVRFRATITNTIDEIEINPPAASSFDAAFGLELTSADILPPPPKIAFNEIAAGTNSGFWLEVINYGGVPVNLAGMEIVNTGTAAPAFVFPQQTLSPGEMLALTQAQLGFGAAEQDKLFLHGPGRYSLLDAVSVRNSIRGRHPDGAGDWKYPSQSTPGATNVFSFHSGVVFNEIQFNAPPIDPTPAVTSNLTVIPITGSWRYHDGGVDLGTGWRAASYDDSGWPAGDGLLHFNAGSLPAPTNTPLAGGHTTYYFRTTFPFSGATSNLSLSLRSIVDDGAIFYLNGVEIYRQNMPAGPITAQSSAETPIGDAGFNGPIALPIPGGGLVQGNNVLAVEVHQITSAATSSGIVINGGGLALVEEGPLGGTVPMNLARRPGATPFVIDSLAGYPIHNYLGLTDGVYGNQNSWIGNSGSPGYAGVSFGGQFTISSVAFGRDNLGTFADRTLGTYTLQYTRVASPGTSTTVTGNPETGWATIGTLNYQSAGTGLFANPSRRHRFTFNPVDATGFRLVVPATAIASGTCIDELEINPPDTRGDIVFGAELALTTTLSPAVPFSDSDEEWIELHNGNAQAIELTGWRIDAGIDYRFPTGAVLQAGGYLVVARDAVALRAVWPEIAESILGDFSGRLQEDEEVTLKDSSGNIVSAVRIHGTGWADGGGSTLELIHPRADTTHPASWAASDETARSQWEAVSYRMIAGQRFGSSFWNEFRLGMLDAGEALIDDVSLVRDPDGTRQELIQNGNFETVTGNTHWRMLGNHGTSQIVPEPGNPGNHVLRVSADSPARTGHNHIESTFLNNSAIADGQEYEVRFRARWLAGSPQVHTAAYFQKLARTTLLKVPKRHGTPGAANSRRIANPGPAFKGLAHSPIVPAANQAVTVTVQAADPDGVAGATLNYRVNPATAFTSVPMDLQPDGAWSASIPGQLAGRIVHFYVSAVDPLGASATAPSAGPASRALYQVADAQGAAIPAHELRLIQLDVDRDFLLNSTNVMSQARLGGTVIYNRAEIFYDVQVRLHGSAAGRARDGDNYISYDIEFPPDHLFRGVQRSVGIDRSGRAPTVRQQDEIYILHMFQRAGLPCHRADLCYFIAPRTIHTGTAILQLGAYDGRFQDEMFGESGSVFNLDLTYEPSTTVGGGLEAPKLPVPLQGHIGTDFADLGNDKEQYRSPFSIRSGERADDYSGILRLCKTMSLSQSQFDSQIGAALDIDRTLRHTALTILCGIGDIYFSSTPSLPHNCRFFVPADGDPAVFLPWDMDFVFTQDPNGSIFPTTSINLSKLVNHPANRRDYLWHVNDLCQTVFNPAYMSAWLAHYGSVVGHNYTGNANYIQTRRNAALNNVPAQVPFAITSNNGNGFTVNTNLVTISGTGWLNVEAIEVNGVPFPLTWTSVTNWTMTLPLVQGTNALTFQVVDRSGTRPPALNDSLSITNTLPATLLPVVINEWMANNAGPGGFLDPMDGLFQDWFELYNPNGTAVNLGGFHLTDDLSRPTKWTIPTNTLINPFGFLLVWADENGAQNSPTNADLHANFRLNNGGESLALFGPDGISPQHVVTFPAQGLNISQGLFPDGATSTHYYMTNWTPRAANQLGLPASPQIVAFTVEGDQITYTFTAIPARTYRLEFKNDLGAEDWLPTEETHTAVAGTLTVSFTVGSHPQQFFRVRIE